jgi:hypothetical protein
VAENWTALYARFPDIHATVLRRVETETEWWSEWEMRATSDGEERTVFAGPVILTTREGLISWSRFYIGPVEESAPLVENSTS